MAQRFVEACWKVKPPDRSRSDSPYGKRFPRFEVNRYFARFLNAWIVGKAVHGNEAPSEQTRRAIAHNLGLDIKALKKDESPFAPLEVHSVRPTVRLHDDGRTKVQLLIVLTQKLVLPLAGDGGSAQGDVSTEVAGLGFKFRGGCTLIIDPDTGRISYAISKNLLSDARQARVRRFLQEQLDHFGPDAIYRFPLVHLDKKPPSKEESQKPTPTRELFALTHRGSFDGDATYG
jgi:hypothetical protein